MGAGNALAALKLWGHLDPCPRLALAFMALQSLDGDPQPRYWAGWEPIARDALGRRDLPARPDPYDRSPQAAQARAVRHAAEVAVEAAVRPLKRAGAVRVVRKGGQGRNAEYALNVGFLPQAQPVAMAGANGASPQGQPVAVAQGQPVAELQGQPVARPQAEPVAEPQGQPVAEEDRGGLRNTRRRTSPESGTSPAAGLDPSDDKITISRGALRERIAAQRTPAPC